MELNDVKELLASGFTPEQITSLSVNWKLEHKPGEGGNPNPGEGGNPNPGEGGNPNPGEGDNPNPGEGGNPNPGEGINPNPNPNPSVGSKIIESLQNELKGLKETIQASNLLNAKQQASKPDLSTDEILANAMNPFIDKRKEK